MKLRVALGDLAASHVDAVVRVVGRGRRRQVAGDELALLAAAGPEAAAAFEELLGLDRPDGVPLGGALTTTAGDLPARTLIHVRPPSYAVARPAEHVLSATYRATLGAADAVGARSLALVPFGFVRPYWPLEVAVRVALSTVSNTPTGVRRVTFVVRTPAALDVIAEALARG